eukprot:7016089-Alexandrium_andersonii.AAC.1
MTAHVFPLDGWRAVPPSIGLPAEPEHHVFRVLSHDAKARELHGVLEHLNSTLATPAASLRYDFNRIEAGR